MTRLLALLVLTLALAGCGSDAGNDEAASTNPAPPPAKTASSPPSMQTIPECMPLPGVGLDTQMSSALENRETMYLTSVSEDTEDNGCSATVEFTFERQAPGPGFEVSYQPASTAKIQDGSGRELEIEGNAFLVVKLTPAMTAKIDGDQVTKTYKGPNRVQSDVPSFIKEIVKTGDFENTVTWVIGLDEKRPFKTAAGDAGLEIDIDGS
jgi:hypothetical protein